MFYFTAVSLFSGLGTPRSREPGSIEVGFELGAIPYLDQDQRRVGFDGTTEEDLNKSPIFAREFGCAARARQRYAIDTAQDSDKRRVHRRNLMQIGSRVARALVALVVALAMSASAGVAQAFTVTPFGLTDYLIDGQNDPMLTLTRGQTYVFNVDAFGHPFWIKTAHSTTSANRYDNGVTNNGVQQGTLTFAVPLDAPSTLFYSCGNHPQMWGPINVVEAPTPTRSATTSPSPTPSQTRTTTASPSATVTPTTDLNSTPTSTPTAGCVGDCNGGGSVTVDEVVSLVNIGAGEPDPPSCPQGILGGSTVDLTLLVEAVTNALGQCSPGE